MAALKKVQDTISKKLSDMIAATVFFEQYVTKRFQPMFSRTQQKRWQTQNASEGAQWKPLNPWYELWKKEAYKDNYGHGEQMMIATGRLFKGLTLASDGEWERILTGTTVVYNFPIEYASEAGRIRPILEFSDETLDGWRKDFKEWMVKQWRLRT